MKKLFKNESELHEFTEKFDKIHDMVVDYHKLRFDETIEYPTIEDIDGGLVEYSYEVRCRGCSDTEWSTMSTKYLLMDENEFLKAITKERVEAEKEAEQKQLEKEKKEKKEKQKRDFAKYLELKEQFEK